MVTQHKTCKSNNIKLLITLLGTMAASAGGGGLPGSLGTGGIIIINIIAWHGSMAEESSLLDERKRLLSTTDDTVESSLTRGH